MRSLLVACGATSTVGIACMVVVALAVNAGVNPTEMILPFLLSGIITLAVPIFVLGYASGITFFAALRILGK